MTSATPAVVRGVSRGEPSYRFHARYKAALWSAPWQVPLFRELRDGRLLLCEPGPRERLPEMGHFNLPVVLLVDEPR